MRHRSPLSTAYICASPDRPNSITAKAPQRTPGDHQEPHHPGRRRPVAGEVATDPPAELSGQQVEGRVLQYLRSASPPDHQGSIEACRGMGTGRTERGSGRQATQEG